MNALDAELRRLAGRVDAPYDATSDSNDSLDDAATAPSKKRKPTYYVRKDEKAALEKELEELHAHIRRLESTHHGSAKKALDQSMALNALLSADVEVNNLALAGAQSMISAEMVSRFRNPVDHYIYLPDDAALRRESLRSLKALKLEAALRLTRERMRHLDIRQPHRHCETTVLKNGDFVMTLFDVTPFDGYSDTRVVFEQFQTFVMNQEISISEHLGTLSIRETDEPADPAVTQCRLLTTVTPGVHVESNLVMCSRFFDTPEDDPNMTAAYGIGTVDYIDKDDVYPYQSSTRVRKDITATAFFTQTKPDPNDASDNAGISVSMVRFATVRLHLPQFPLSRQELAAARTHASKWGDVMPQAMHERLGLT